MCMSMCDISTIDGQLTAKKDGKLTANKDGELTAKKEGELTANKDDELTFDEEGELVTWKKKYTPEMRSRYWRGVWKSDGFDLEGLEEISPPRHGLITCRSESQSGYRTEIVLYAKFGIHVYNARHNLQFSCMEKFNYLPEFVKCTNFITCLAKDPACGSTQVFQTCVSEQGFGIKTLYCSEARLKFRPQEKPLEPSSNQEEEEAPEPYNYGDKILPEWPSENALRDKSRFYLLKKSDLKKYGWIRLYLELAFFKANRKLKKPDLTKLVIGRVAVESRQENVEPPTERLNAVNSVIYIKYKYLPNKGRAPKGVHSLKPPRDRMAVIKRTLYKRTGQITLMFETDCAKTFL